MSWLLDSSNVRIVWQHGILIPDTLLKSTVYSLMERVGDSRTVFLGWNLFNRRDLTITSCANLDLYDMSFGELLGKA